MSWSYSGTKIRFIASKGAALAENYCDERC
jgi:hypothetical protein